MDESHAPVLIDLNDKGVAYIYHFQYDAAIACFSSALKLLKRGYLAPSTNATTSSKNNINSTCPVHSCDWAFCTTEIPPFLTECAEFVFRCPIKARLHHDTCCVTKMSAITLYNLALSHHLKALQCGSGSDEQRRRLNIALSLYAYTSKLQLQPQQQRQPQQPSEHDDSSRLSQQQQQQQPAPICDVHLAILNNVGQIHTFLEDYVQANFFFTNLLSNMIFIVDQSGTGYLERSKEAWEGFLSNVIDLILQCPSSAPAA